MLENMGLKVIAERPYGLEFSGGRRAWIQDLELVMQAPAAITFEALDGEIKSAFTAVWTGRMDSDSFNQLTLAGRRAVAHGDGAARLLPLFAADRPALQPGLHRAGAGEQSPISRAASPTCSSRASTRDLSDGGAARRARAARPATSAPGSRKSRAPTRTGSCAPCGMRCRRPCAPTPTKPPRRGQLKDYLSFKIESQKLRELPLPKPLFEIFVFSTRMEGVHLRMGYVARGGIRWSDRREDFRTEILGLMKAQQVKNTVIVPVGAKGGFVVRRAAAGDREAQQAEVIACYQTLIRGLLDVTDNIVDEKIVAAAAGRAARRR